MSVKRIQLLAAVSLFAVSAVAPAMAADMATKTYHKAPVLVAAPIYDWSGLYVGVNAGGGWSHNCFTVTEIQRDLGCHDATGGTIGGQVGYRWQLGAWVLGVEGQGNWASFGGRHDPFGTGEFAIGSKADSFGLFTGQVGHTWGNSLLYLKGGAAVVHNSFDFWNGPNRAPAGAPLATFGDTRWGGTIGAGFEYGLSANWTLGVEYDHIFLSRRDLDVNWTDGNRGTAHVSQDIDMGLVRLNYKFGGPMVVKY